MLRKCNVIVMKLSKNCCRITSLVTSISHYLVIYPFISNKWWNLTRQILVRTSIPPVGPWPLTIDCTSYIYLSPCLFVSFRDLVNIVAYSMAASQSVLIGYSHGGAMPFLPCQLYLRMNLPIKLRMGKLLVILAYLLSRF